MGRTREDAGGGVDSRWRARRSNGHHWLMFMGFALVVCVTILISIHTPLGFNQSSYSEEENRFEDDGTFGPRKPLQRPEMDPYTPVQPDALHSSGWARTWRYMLPGVYEDEIFDCVRSHIRTDVCRMHGNVHLVGNSSFVLEAVGERTRAREEKIRPYTRKWEQPCMEKVVELTLRSQRNSSPDVCDVRHNVPAVVFSTDGYTGNVYHEFHDGLIPLYITSQHLKGEVIFVISGYHSWWMVRYQEIIKQLSKYEVIDIANYTQAHCFSDVTVGLFIHEELGIDQSLMPKNKSIRDFRLLLSRAYIPEEPGWEKEFSTFKSSLAQESTDSGPVPRLAIIVREGSRVILNLDQVIELATKLGFDVTILKPDPTTEMKKIFWLLDKCDVLISVHGAASTHFLFMRPGSVFIQIVPLGTIWAAKTYYGDPAKKLGLQYFEYQISVNESSLSREYEKNDPVLADPNAVVQQGWSVIKEIYLGKQNVELSLPKFYKTLKAAKRKAERFQEREDIKRRKKASRKAQIVR